MKKVCFTTPGPNLQTAVLWDEQLWNEQLWIEDAYKATVFNTIKYTLNSGCIILRCVYFFHSAAF